LKYTYPVKVEEAVVGDDGKIVEIRVVMEKETAIKPKGESSLQYRYY